MPEHVARRLELLREQIDDAGHPDARDLDDSDRALLQEFSRRLDLLQYSNQLLY